MVNSRLGLFTAASASLKGKPWHQQRRSFSRSYGANMPSSLTMVLPIASVCSTRLPVSVLVRAPGRCLEVFLGSMGSPASLSCFVSRLRECVRADFHALTPYTLSRGRPEPRPATLLRRPFGHNVSRRYRNICLLCIGYAFRPYLSSRLTLGGLALPRNP